MIYGYKKYKVTVWLIDQTVALLLSSIPITSEMEFDLYKNGIILLD